jgi:ionotropic glutamate receptor
LQKDDDRISKANELSLANVGGVFVVLLAGMGLACLIAVFEFIWKSRQLATSDHVKLIRLTVNLVTNLIDFCGNLN